MPPGRLQAAARLQHAEGQSRARRACAGALYAAMGIARDDKAGRYDAWLRNFELFDAPHVAVVSVDDDAVPDPYFRASDGRR